MNRKAGCLTVGLFGLFIVSSSLLAAASDRKLSLGTPDEIILKRAVQEEKALWRIPLGAVLVEDMRLLAPGKLLLGLKDDSPGLPNLDYMLIDSDSGKIIWRYERGKKGKAFDPILVLEDLLVFRVEEGKTTSLLAVDATRGAERWSASFSGELRFYPHPGAALALAERREKGKVTLSALGLLDGSVRWTKEFTAKEGDLPHLRLIVAARSVWHFYGPVAALSATDGQALWSRNDIAFEPGDPPPQMDGEELFILHAGNKLSALDAFTGSTRWTVSLPAQVDYTNLYPYQQRIYVRGILTPAGEAAVGGGMHRTSALRREDGRLLWTYSSGEPSVSNLIEANGRLFFATPTSLVALDPENGRELFSSEATNSTAAYPVRIHAYPDKVVFVGELIVVAFDPASGKQIYSHGMSPVSNEAFLAGLDTAIPRLKEAVANLSGRRPLSGVSAGGTSASSTFARRQIESYQNMASSYRHTASMARAAGRSGDARYYSSMASIQQQAAGNLAQIDSAFQRAQASIDLFFATRELAQTLARALEAAAMRTALERQELFRRSILAAYGMAESDDYVYRPNRKYRTEADEFITLTVVHLPTGKRRDTYLSPAYMNLGLWNLVDFGRGIVYHHGIGMDPSVYEFSEPHQLHSYGKVKTIESFLIAAPVRIPQ